MVLINTAAAVAVGVLTSATAALGVGTLHQGADTATPTTTASHQQSRHPSQPCHRALAKLPQGLRSDLAAARRQPVGDRHKAVREVRQKALHGDYGTATQRWAERRIYRQARVRAQLPDKLRTDLRAVRKLPADERRTARQGIRDKVLAGGYGDAVQQEARQKKERRQQHRAACAASRRS